MAKFLPASRRNPCPVCAGTDGSCSIASEAFVMCHQESADVPGWKFSGYSKNGFQQYFNKVDLNDRFDASEWERRKEERDRRKEEQRQAELFELSKALPIDERSAQNWQWLNQLTLDRDHYQNLKARGLSDRQIKFGGFKSVAPGQTLAKPISPRLAGIDRTGRKVWVAGRGILCPAYNLKGQIVGMQLRLDGGDGGKYRWLKSQFGSKLPNGEMPITVVKPEGAIKRIGLAEGLLKPFIAAKLSHNTAFIGAAGGNFTASAQQLKEAILALLSENPEAEIAFYPDAGAIANQQVQKRDRRTLELLEEWGYEPKIAYWDQGTDKSGLDIDELLGAVRGGEIKFVSPENYQKQGEKALCHQRAKDAYASLTRLTYPVSIELNQQFLDGGANLIEWGKLNFVSSACKTGKTALLGEVVERHRAEFPQAKTYAIGYRNALLRQTCQRTGLTHIEALQSREEGAGKGFRNDPRLVNGTREIALCLDSLLKIELEKIQPNSLVILDEVDAIISHSIEGGTLGDDQEIILTHWKAFLNRVLELGGTVLGMEDDLTDIPIDFLREFTGNRFETRLIRNSYQASKWNVEIGSGSPYGLLRKAIESVEAGKKIAIAFTGQERGELSHAVIDQETNGKLKIVRIDRETTQAGADTTVAMHELMTAPDEWVDGHRPDILQFSPVIESGVSFWTEHFDEYYFFASHLETRKHIQILERIRRDDVKRYIHVRDYCPSHGGLDPDRILKDLHRTARQTARVTGLNPEKLDALESQNQDSDLFNRYAAKYQARHNAAAVRMAGNLIDALKERGHNVTETKWGRDERIEELYKAAKTAKEQKDADDWHAAPGDSSVSAAKETLKSPNSTREDRIDAQKSILKADYPGIDMSRDFLLEMVLRRRRAGLKETELEWIVENPEIAAILDRRAMESALDKPLLMYRRLTHRRLKGDLIRSLDGFIEALQSGKELRPSDSEVECWHQILCDRRQEVYRILGLTAHSDIKPMRLLSYVADRLGYDFKAIKREGSRGNRQRVYVANERHPEHRAAIKEALDRRYASLLKEDAAAIAQSLDAARDSAPVTAKRNTTLCINHFTDTNIMESVKALQTGDSGVTSEDLEGIAGMLDAFSSEGSLDGEAMIDLTAHLTKDEKRQVWEQLPPETQNRLRAIAS